MTRTLETRLQRLEAQRPVRVPLPDEMVRFLGREDGSRIEDLTAGERSRLGVAIAAELHSRGDCPMNRNLSTRLAKLEGMGASVRQIPVYCDGEWNFERTVDQMIARGELSPDDRPRCIWWLRQQDVPVGTHEAWLESLEAKCWAQR